MLKNFIDGGAAVNQLCEIADSDLRVYEMALEAPTRDFSEAPAMDEDDCARAIAYGMTAVEAGVDVLALGEMGIANTTSAAAVCCALFGGAAGDWVGRGTGIDDKRLVHKTAVVEAAVAKHRAGMGDPLQVLRHLGGFELAAILGAVLAARQARTPVILDGYTCTAAAAVLFAMDGHALDHCLVAHISAEPGHRPPVGAARQARAVRFRHALGRRLGRGARHTSAESRLRLSRGHGDVRRRRRQRAGLVFSE